MATFSSVSSQHVLQALAEYDARGEDDFLAAYGFTPTPGYDVVHEGRDYDAKAVLGVAHRFATGRLAAPDEFHDGMQAVVTLLRKRGFEVTEPPSAVRAAAVRAPAARSPRAPRASRAGRAGAAPKPLTPAARDAVRDAAPAICPTCLMTLPATGRCDDCD